MEPCEANPSVAARALTKHGKESVLVTGSASDIDSMIGCRAGATTSTGPSSQSEAAKAPITKYLRIVFTKTIHLQRSLHGLLMIAPFLHLFAPCNM